jgi:phosphohistidine swiveling domain-containing protein
LEKWVYLFQEGAGSNKLLFGGKGSRLCEMAQIGLPVPPGLIVTTEVCKAYYANNKQFPAGMWDQVMNALLEIEKSVGKTIGDECNPLLVSVRSGAALSMPGLLETILNLGLNEQILQGLAEQTGDLRFALDAYRRFISLFGEIVMGVQHEKFERVMDRFKAQSTGGRDTDLKLDELREIIAEEKQILLAQQQGIPDDPYKQLQMAIAAVLNSWMNRRAVDYRRINHIPDELGTAVIIESQVFGNMGSNSGTGVAFTRNPSNGKKQLYGEYLINAQGEDVVDGIRTPNSISQLEKELPEVFEQFNAIAQLLEKHYGDMQDCEFTIERGKLWLLQTRTAKRSGSAGLRLALDFLDEGLISEHQAILRILPKWIADRFAPRLHQTSTPPMAVGLPGSPGIAIGVVALTPQSLQKFKKAGKKVVFVCYEGSPEYFDSIVQSDGVVSLRGGMTGHAAVVCRGLERPCVTGLMRMEINFDDAVLSGAAVKVSEGDLITVDAYSGQIFSGALALDKATPDESVSRIGSLLWRAKTIDYIDDGLGLLWQLRDTIRDQGLQHASLSNPTAYSLRSPQQPSLVAKSYTSFVQPPPSEIGDILRALHWDNSGDTNLIAWSILYELQRQLQTEIGIGNHPLVLRPLNDPELTFFDRDSFSLLAPAESNTDFGNRVYQLVGVEFFGINRLLRHALPWGCVQWWGAVRIDSSLLDAWELDRVNPNGESLVARSRELAALLITLDDKPLTVEKTRKWYQEFRERELGWSWYRDNNLSIREVVDILQDMKMGRGVDERNVIKLRSIGLLSAEVALTTQGLSLIENQTARDRRHLTFEGRVLTDA